MFPPEQLKREKIRAITLAIIELVLGSLMIYIGFQLLSLGMSALASYIPGYGDGLYDAPTMMIIAGGVFSIVHAIKRMVDNVLNAWVKSALPEE